MTLNRSHDLPRISYLWLAGGQSLSMAPLLVQLPLWLLLVWGGVLLWRVMEFKGRWSSPSVPVRSIMIVVSVVGLLTSFGRLVGMEPMVAMLVCAALLKQLELRRHRDALLLIYLTYFLIATQFLFSQTLLAGMFGLGCFVVNTTALISIHQPQGHYQPLRSLRLSLRLLLHSIPLMVLLFLLMPRIGSLWAVPTSNQSAVTGVSDSMAPGDFTRLSRSADAAFRVAFDGAVPPRDKLYWRGLVFSRFDGRQWRQAEPYDYRLSGKVVNWQGEVNHSWRNLLQPLSDPVGYSVIMEPSRQPWLYTLELATSYQSGTQMQLGYARDFRLLSRKPITQSFQYKAISHLNYRLEADELPEWRRKNELSLPESYNPVSLARAKQWRQQSNSPEEYIDKLLSFYRDKFTYTLQPAALGRESVDDFLWQTQQGFCEHFASSFVVMSRAAGIPARVVVGYLGGEYNSVEQYLVVHQYDAHAWAEVWFEGRGWVRVDPTAAVAPERIEQSLGEIDPASSGALISLGRYRHFPLIAKLRLQWDALQYRWDRAILGFDRKAQVEFLDRWLNGASPLKLLAVIVGAGGATLALVGLHLGWSRRPQRKEQGVIFLTRVEKLLSRRGLMRKPGETVGDFTSRVAKETPELASAMRLIRSSFEQHYYAGRPLENRQFRLVLAQLKQALKKNPC